MKLRKIMAAFLSCVMLSSTFTMIANAKMDTDPKASMNVKVLSVDGKKAYLQVNVDAEAFAEAEMGQDDFGDPVLNSITGASAFGLNLQLNSTYFGATAKMYSEFGALVTTANPSKFQMTYANNLLNAQYVTGTPALFHTGGEYCQILVLLTEAGQALTLDELNKNIGSYVSAQITTDVFKDQVLVNDLATVSAAGTASGHYPLTATLGAGTIDVTGVTLDQSAVELDLNGTKTATLTATVTPDNATDPTVTWTSSNTDVVTVANGVVTAVGKGEATITATAGDFSATCAVTVVDTTPATSGKGEITKEQSGSENDVAIWEWKELKGNGTNVTVNIDPKGAAANVTSLTFPLKAIVENAGATKVGIIIQYSEVEFPNGVEITSIDWAN